MRAKEIVALLNATVPAKLPVMIKGAPGVGKSDIVAQVASALGANLVLMHPVVSDPTDAKGMPAVVDGKAEFLAYGDLRKLMEAKKLTIAFLDDLGQAPAVVQAAYMQLILARQVNGHKVSDHVVFVAATNRKEDRAGVTGILEPVKSRFASIVELTPSLDDWSEWALNNNVPVELVAFVRFRPDLFMPSTPPTGDMVNRPCPRTITQLGKLYNAGIRSPEALGGAAGQGFATEFVGFVRIYQALPTMDGIIANPMTAQVPSEPAALYAVATALATKIDKTNAGKIIKYLTRLPEEFSVLGIRDANRKFPGMANTREFLEWATAHQGVLV